MRRIVANARDQLRSYRASFRIVWASGSRWALVGALLLLAQGVLPAATLVLIRGVVDDVARLGPAAPPSLAPHLALLVGLAAAVALLDAACRSASDLVDEVQTQKLTDHVLDLVHEKSISVDIQYYETSEYHDAFYRAHREAPAYPPRIIRGVVNVLRSGVTLATMAGLLLTFHWGVALGLVLATAAGASARLRQAHRSYLRRRDQTATDRKADHLNWLISDVQATKEIRLFAIGGRLIDWYQGFRGRLRRMELRLAAEKAAIDLAARGGEALALYAAFGFAVYQTGRGLLTLGGLVMYFQIFQRCQGALQELLGGLVELYENNLFLTNLHEYLALPRLVPEPAVPSPFPRPIRLGIEFRGVGFRYDRTSDRYALRGVDLRINPGEIVAVVGPNGSGKTTLAKLLCRFYDPTEGSIAVDGVDLRDFSPAEHRRQVSAIFQDFMHFNFRVRDNVEFGDLAIRDADDPRVVDACVRSGADPFIRNLPAGYETYLGKWFEDGSDLSIGEWQKLALARTLLRDSPIIVLDEPSSAMDARAEREFFERFYQSTRDKMVVLISHRLTTIRMADRIYVMGGGRVLESGTYDDLSRCGKAFNEMFGTRRKRAGTHEYQSGDAEEWIRQP